MIHHGAIRPAELEALGIDPATVIDFSSNVNPFGPSPTVIEAIQQVINYGEDIERYPDPDVLALRRQLAQIHGVSIEQILVGNGSVELLWLIAFTFLGPNRRALILGPTFGEYAHTAQLAGSPVEILSATVENGFRVELDVVSKRLKSESWQLVYLCNPNNPTGTLLAAETIADLAQQFSKTLFLVDEAYIDFVDEAVSLVGYALPNVLILRSLTKAHALAGLRLGYLVGPANLVAMLRAKCPPWNVNALAQSAGVAALQDRAHLSSTLQRLKDETDQLHNELIQIGFEVISSRTNFFLVDVGDAATMRSQLLQKGLMVRDCASFGLPRFIRIATRRPEENKRLVTALMQVQRIEMENQQSWEPLP